MNIRNLLAKLAEIGVESVEARVGEHTVYVLSCKLPEFPFGGREWAWYTLIMESGQTEVDRDEVEAILRHLWHAEQDFFGDEEEPESGEPQI